MFCVDLTLSLVQRAETAGFKAIVLTVDTPVFGQREADVRNRFSLPHHLKLANFMDAKREYAHVQSSDGSGVAEYVSTFFDPAICWDDLKWLKRNTSLPLVIKGILTAEDALMVAEIGCEAIIVSNHGARQLDGVLASIEALPEVVKAVRGKNIEVYVDGGVRRGTDIFKVFNSKISCACISNSNREGTCARRPSGFLRSTDFVGTQSRCKFGTI